MRVGIVGGGASSIYFAIALKQRRPDIEVALFEKEDRLGRKLYATGNGHCNLLNANLSGDAYNHPEFIGNLIAEYPLATLRSFLEGIGILLFDQGEYVYPLTYSAASYVATLERALRTLGVSVKLGDTCIDYRVDRNGITLMTDGGEERLDHLVIATGGMSTPNLGSDGSFSEVLRKHGYSVVPPLPGLAPMRVKEAKYMKPLAGVRHPAEVTVTMKGKVIHREFGEVLFKDNGLSGIVIYNCESAIARAMADEGCVLSLDLFPGEDPEVLLKKAKKALGGDFLSGILVEPLQKEARRQCLLRFGDESVPHLAKVISSLEYTFDKSYPFRNSQVTVGGVALSEIDGSFRSKREDGVSIIGEALDVDGYCGGYNLSFALLSALKAADSF
jgi:predicted Rossmann fold flavoprotein